jgi:hypothetical protein
MEANNFNAVYGSCFRAANCSGSALRHRRLQAATSRWPIAFDPEGLPLDRGISLNYGIRVKRFNVRKGSFATLFGAWGSPAARLSQRCKLS